MLAEKSPPHTTSTPFARGAKWMALTTGGLSLGWALSALFRFEEATALVLLPGITSGIAQWWFFRPLPKAFLWLVISTLSSPFVGFLVIVMLLHSYPTDLDPPLYARIAVSSLILLATGLAQFLVLRRWFLHTGLWIPTSAIAWLIAYLLLDSLKYLQSWPATTGLPAFFQLAFFGAFLGAVQGSITGALIAYLEPRPPPGA